jgi:hypothetical protein
MTDDKTTQDKSRAGKIGGPARAAILTPERRSEIARMGALKAQENRKKRLTGQNE